jgi:hypothetical protein
MELKKMIGLRIKVRFVFYYVGKLRYCDDPYCYPNRVAKEVAMDVCLPIQLPEPVII